MGIFNKTDEELRIIKERKDLKELKEAIKSNKELANDKVGQEFLIKYIDDIINGKENNFFESDFLIRAFLKFDNVLDLTNAIYVVRNLLPYGLNTPNYDAIKEVILSDFLGTGGYVTEGIFDHEVYALFKDFDNYLRIMRTVQGKPSTRNNFNLIASYIKESAKYSIDEDTFTKSIISTIDNLDDSVLDIPAYLKNELEKDKKRAGVYSISHDDVISASSSLRRIDSQIEKIDNYILTLEEKARDAINEADNGVKKINESHSIAIRELKEYKSSLEKELKNILERHLEDSKIEINNKADAVFSEILKKYQEQLEEFRKVSQNLSLQNTRELTILKEETNKSLNELRDYVSNKPELKEYLKQAEESAVIRDKIINLVETSKSEELEETGIDEKVVKGISRIVVPHSISVEVPDSVLVPKDVQIIKPYAFKNAKQFAAIMKKLREKMNENILNGEIYNPKIEEILACLLLGDWPYVFGPSGAGKGYMVNQIGDLLDRKICDNGKITDLHTILGYIDPQGRFRAPSAVEAVSQGDILFLDEFDNSNPDTMIVLNTIYSNLRDKIKHPEKNYFVRFAGEIDIPINPNMRMIAAANTDGSGSNAQHNVRYKIDEAVQERYKPVYFPYNNDVERQILKDYDVWYDFFVNFRNGCEEFAKSQGEEIAEGNVSTRDASDILRDIKFDAKPLTDIMNEYFVQSKGSDYRNFLIRYISDVYDFDSSDYDEYNGPLKDASSKVLATHFIDRAKKGIKG